MVTVGEDVYPVPAFVTVIEATAPPLIFAVAVAVVPPDVSGADNVTVGVDEYPLPPLVITTEDTRLDTADNVITA